MILIFLFSQEEDYSLTDSSLWVIGYELLQPLDTASARMQTSTFGKSKSLWATLTEGSWSEAYAGIGASLILVSNPAIQVPHHNTALMWSC